MFHLLKVSGGMVLKRGEVRIAVAPELSGGTMAFVAGSEDDTLFSIAVVGESAPIDAPSTTGAFVSVVPVPDAPEYPGWYTVGSRVTQWTSTRKVCLLYA